jgi:hypothetical protein
VNFDSILVWVLCVEPNCCLTYKYLSYTIFEVRERNPKTLERERF